MPMFHIPIPNIFHFILDPGLSQVFNKTQCYMVYTQTTKWDENHGTGFFTEVLISNLVYN